MKKEETHFLFNKLRSSFGSDEEAELYTCTDIQTGETSVILKKTVSQRFPIQKLEEAKRLYDTLTEGNGRYVLKPEDLVGLRPKKKQKG